MARTSSVVWLGVGLVFSTGCTHFMETRTVAKFAEALDEKDAKQLKAAATPTFKKKALRHEDALEDLKILNLPKGKIKVVQVKEEGENRKLVNVEVGERKRKLQYELVRDEKTGDWLIDNIRTPKRRNGIVVARSVTEQMDLLLTVREFLEHCAAGEREKLLKACTPELSAALTKLPPKSLSQMVKPIAGEKDERKKQKPKATLDGPAALVELRRKNGRLLMKFSQVKDQWKVADVALESLKDKNHINSLHKQAVVVQATRDFLKAYAAGNRKALSQLCTPKLYRESLRYANLKEFALPASDDGKQNFTVTLKGGKANAVMTDGDASLIRITLTEIKPGDKDATLEKEYRVEDVARYRRNSKQETRISSYFVSRAWVKEFAEALATGDLGVLMKASTAEFNRRVWSLADKNLMRELPTLGLTDPRIRIESTTHHGPVTEVMAKQGNIDTTYILREREGRVRIDDVQVIEYGKPKSLKTFLRLAIPIARFRRGIIEGDIPELQKNSSRGMNRLVWSQTRVLPSSAKHAPRYLNGKVTAINRTGDDYLLTYGDSQRGARVLLVPENGKYVVDDMTLIAGPMPSERAQLKQRLRLELATSTRLSVKSRGVMQAGNTKSRPNADANNAVAWRDNPRRTGVRHAMHTAAATGNDFRSNDAQRSPVIVDPYGTAFSDPVNVDNTGRSSGATH